MRTERLLVRLDAETKRVLQQLAERQGTSLSDAARLAIRETGWRRGLSGHDGDLFTERARQVLQHSNDEAISQGAGEIRPLHLLLALLSVEDGRAALVLRTLGVDLERAYEVADGLAAAPEAPATAQRGVSPSGKRVIEQAVAAANRLDHHYVGTEHLLLGLLEADEARVSAQVFEQLGVSVDGIRAAVELQKERFARVFP